MSNNSSSSGKPAVKSESDVKAFVIVMTILIVITAALTSGTYNGYSPNPNSVAITGFLAVLTIVITAVWYRTKYNNYSYEPKD